MAKIILLVLLFLALPGSANAAPFQQNGTEISASVPARNSYAAWLEELQQEAVANGISPQTARTALGEAILDERVMELDRKQPEKTATFDSYIKRIVTPSRIETGRELLQQYGPQLREIGQRYNVQPEVIVALWGMESSFGRNSGDYSIIDSLVTLAYEGRRASFFRKELFNALRILDQERMPAANLLGSWAGAMGQCQFMPSTYLRHAVDYNGDGVKNIWTEQTDIWASIANYIAAEGWRGDQSWGREVELGNDIPTSEVGLDHQRSLAEWKQLGIRAKNGAPLPDMAINASLVQPDGPDGRSFLAYDNFRALMRWNRSTYFATAVGLLSDRISQ